MPSGRAAFLERLNEVLDAEPKAAASRRRDPKYAQCAVFTVA